MPAHDAAAPILLLGVTPELAALPRSLLAVERNRRIIDAAWIGSSPERQIVRGDWRQFPLSEASVAAAIGDGSFSGLLNPSEYGPLFDQLRRVVRPAGQAIVRCFATPEHPEPVEAVAEAAWSGTIPFHIFKLRFNMAAAHELGGNVTSDQAFRRFEGLFPDRGRLARASGWTLAAIAEMDTYKDDSANHSYPSRSELNAILAGRAAEWRFAETSGYPLAERCPLLVARLS